jgi:sulfoxide reductase heme-binding subunit YedZ
MAAPALRMAWQAFNDGLGANPIEAITKGSGIWTLRMLLVTLAVTPVRRLTGWAELASFRRMAGLAAFAYAMAHLATYVGLDKFFEWDAIWADVLKRRFITAGFFAAVLLVPLAVTSTKGWTKRLGGRRWRALHRLVYVSAATGVIHYWWLVKADVRDPAAYAGVLGVLLLARAVASRSGTIPVAQSQTAGQAAGQ